jgi:hypothetical protein
VSVDITDPGGDVSHLALPFDQPRVDPRPTRFPGETTCRAYFDRESDLIAIGMDDGSVSAWVAVVDSRHKTWLGHWTLGPTAGILHPRLAGFFGKNVIVIGQPFTRTGRRVQAREGSSLSLVFDPQGQQFQGGPVERTYASGHRYPIYADAGNNRLWFLACATVPGHSQQPDCPVDWLALTGDTSSTEFNPHKPYQRRSDLWTGYGHIVAATADTIVVAELKRVWVVNVKEQTLERLNLPGSFVREEGIWGDGSTSPDGEIAVFPVSKHRLAFPYIVDNWVPAGTDFVVAQLHPLRLLRVVRGGNGNDVTSCAVGHRDGRVELLVFRDDHWEHVALRP